MGGAAAVLAAFQAAVKARSGGRPLHAILCLAENSVDAVSTRPDDVITLYSGKTVSQLSSSPGDKLFTGCVRRGLISTPCCRFHVVI